MEGNNADFARLNHLITHSTLDEPIAFKLKYSSVDDSLC
jgi:hypothetical protein